VRAGFDRENGVPNRLRGLNLNVNIGWLDAGTEVLLLWRLEAAGVGVEPASMPDFAAICLARG
jgi:hypothetical protein